MKKYLLSILLLIMAFPAFATVSTETTRVAYTCNGTSTTYAYTFKILADADLQVIKTLTATGAETTLTLATDYTVTGAGTASGNVVLTAGSKCASGYTMTILRDMDVTQETDYVDGEAFSAQSIEDALDKNTMILQQQKEELGRVPKLPTTSTITSIALPTPTANNYIGWNASATGLANITGPVSTTATQYEVDALVSYGGGTSYTQATIAAALTAIGTDVATLLIRPGSWAISTPLAIPGNVTLSMPAGAYFTYSGTGAVTGMKTVTPQMFGAKADGTTNDATAIGNAIGAASGGELRWPAGTYAVTTNVDKTLTGNSKWVADGPVTIKAITNKIYRIIQIEVDSYNLTIEGPLTLDCNSLARIGIRINNDSGITTMAEAADLYLRNVKAINAYSDLNAYGAWGIYAYGAFNNIKMDRCGAVNINRAAALTGSPSNLGIGYGHGGINKYARSVVITDPYIDTVTAADAVGDATYVDMDGINVTGPAADANGNVKVGTSLIVRGGTFINCQGRSIKSQMESNTVDGPLFIHNSSGKKLMASGQDVDFQYGSGVLTNYKMRIGLETTGGTPFPTSWAVCNATARALATAGEGAFSVTNGDIINEVPYATDPLPYLALINSIGGGILKNVNVSNNTMIGGGVGEVLYGELGEVTNITVNNNYAPAVSTALIYSTDAFGSTKVTANGNYDAAAGNKKVTDGAAAVAAWYGFNNYGLSINYNAGVLWGRTASVADGGSINHYMNSATASIVATGTVSGEMVSITAQDANTFTVAIKKHDNSAGTTQTIHWHAYR